ncbi:hypothetical protein WA026_005416 [Henosepilachna vigintioctopunctata]|uniref:CHK kinase-like domain-containing protein n=1 Tax=Henosepilachna vigintioctopunctata TaxID=420089 RepID=A0AAW1TWB7_9CUCU
MEREEILNDLDRLTQKMMYKKGINRYRIKIEGQSNKGDNYVGDITFFTVTSEENGKKYHLVMKTAKRSEEIRKIMGNGKLYTREMYMYSEVFPAIQSFGKLNATSIELKNIPKVYWVSQEDKRETIILENLNIRGYRLWDRTKAMDMNHIMMVLRNYGIFHGLSMAMKHREPELFKKLTKDLDNVMVAFCEMNEVVGIFEEGMKHAMKLLEEAGREDLVEKFKPIVNNIEYQLVKESKEEDKLVITHGDCWTNNMLFQYKQEKDSKPRNVCFVDFQLSTLDSPVKDLSYFIYACCDKSSLDQFDLLLNTYYDSLSCTLRDLDCRAENCLTLQLLKEHWKNYSVYGLVFSTMVTKLALSSSDDAPDINEVGKGKDLKNVFDIRISNVEVYNRRILDMYTHFGDNCL